MKTKSDYTFIELMEFLKPYGTENPIVKKYSITLDNGTTIVTISRPDVKKVEV